MSSPLLETSISGARGILLNITGGSDLSLYEVNEAAGEIALAADDDANIIFGAVVDERLEGQMTVTVIATGFGPETLQKPRPTATAAGARSARHPNPKVLPSSGRRASTPPISTSRRSSGRTTSEPVCMTCSSEG